MPFQLRHGIFVSKKEAKEFGQRFPRLKGINEGTKQRERLLWRTYNRLREKRGRWRVVHYDVYKGKTGSQARLRFLILAQELQKRNIDPVRYVKVLSQYGVFAIKKFLPHPAWLASDKALRIYEIEQYRELNRTHRQEEWKQLRKSFRPQDIYWFIEQAGGFVKTAEKNFKMSEAEAVTAFVWDLSPWFITVYICIAPKKYANLIAQLARSKKETHEALQTCLKFFVENKSIFHRSKEAMLHSLE